MNITFLTHMMLRLNTGAPSSEVQAGNGDLSQPEKCYDYSLDDSGYLQFGGKHGDYESNVGMGLYKLHTTPKSFNSAEQTCVEEGGHLAILETAYEDVALRRLFIEWFIDGSSSDAGFFIGYHDRNEEGRWETVTGDSIQYGYYTRWSRGEPNNAGNEDCCEMCVNGRMNDVSCGRQLPFICEKPTS